MARPNDPNQRKRDSSSPDNPLKGYRERVNVELDRIRETAKWMAGAIALVASILLAGSDLSGIGNLDTCTPRQLMEGSSGTCARFYVALGSGVTAIIATFAAVLLMMKVFLPRDDTMSDFASLKANHRVVKWFREHPTFVRD
ncbi:MAG: hypothetical protein IH850_06830, partial [Acidobacteria bacterium]|nr:hypothetical protein [Acidobacteriota bacterium]